MAALKGGTVTSVDWIMIGCAVVAAALAGIGSAVETALVSITPTRAEQMVADGKRGAPAVKQITDDPAPETSTAAFLRVACEVISI
ncbi:CNNM domain-containing protein, partial [Brooklawnia sp.]|uniref:CNNM domain-containing protein n=1 Tax=Brooklawnia sp. TaxID=2699740 RepID=UPI00311E76C9